MNRFLFPSVWFLAIAVVALGVTSCSKPQPKNPTVAEVNGDAIKMIELREALGVLRGLTPAAGVAPERKKEALDRLIAGRLLAQEAKAQGLDNTDEFRNVMKTREQTALIAALFQKELSSKGMVSKEDLQAEAKKMQAADNSLSDNNANARARRSLTEGRIRKIQEELIASANKEFPSTIHKEWVDKIVKGEGVPEEAVLASAAGDNVTYGEVKKKLDSMGARMGDGQDISRNPIAINRLLTRETTGRALIAYARKQGLEGSEWHKSVREEIERSILFDQLSRKIVEKDAQVTDKEVEGYFKEHPEMFTTRKGKKIPLALIKEQLRAFLQNERRKSAMETYIEELKKKAKITVNEKALGEV